MAADLVRNGDFERRGPTTATMGLAAGTALTITFTVTIFTPWGIPIGIILSAVALIGWFWPKPPYKELMEEQP